MIRLLIATKFYIGVIAFKQYQLKLLRAVVRPLVQVCPSLVHGCVQNDEH